MPRSYIPEAGDIIWLQFNPQAGHEQAGHRPALVISPATYNKKTGLLLCCPMTTHIKNYPFEVIISDKNTSVVLADQIKNIDWIARKAAYKGKVSPMILDKVRALIICLINNTL